MDGSDPAPPFSLNPFPMGSRGPVNLGTNANSTVSSVTTTHLPPSTSAASSASLDLSTSSISSSLPTTTSSSLDLAGGLVSSLRHLFHTMTGGGLNDTCLYNCSGRGECLQGTCLCQVQYHGDSCTDPNLAYFVSLATLFYVIAFVSLAQLVVCVRAEYSRMKTPSLRAACGVTTQKMLYVITCAAAVLRGAYFSSPSHADLPLSSSFMSAFYPIILTAGSLIVCFWAEAFHLRDIRCDRPRFLSKSFCGFATFNVITYSLFVAEVILTQETTTQEERSFLAHVFNGCYAVLMFIVVVFFLIYGVEVYFKVRGGFVSDTIIVGNVQSRSAVVVPPPPNAPGGVEAPLLSPSSGGEGSYSPPSTSFHFGYPECSLSSTGEREEGGKEGGKEGGGGGGGGGSEASRKLLAKNKLPIDLSSLMPQRGIDQSQLHQSRFGLIFQACMLMITVCFLCSDVLGGFWKNKVPLMSRNAYDIIFRVVEVAVALWFPCVLWNCISPEQLWILNPKKILKKLDFEKTLELGQAIGSKDASCSQSDLLGDCWICYDSDSVSGGPMIRPCHCKGDVGAVHHNCLRKWLMECAPTSSSETLSCKVCGAPYQLERKKIWWIGKGFTATQWLHTASLVTVMCGTIAGFWSAMQLCEDAFKRAMAAGATLIVLYICLRLLGFNFFTGYQRAKISAVNILGGRFTSSSSSSSNSSTSSTAASSVTAAAVAPPVVAAAVATTDVKIDNARTNPTEIRASGVGPFPMPQTAI